MTGELINAIDVQLSQLPWPHRPKCQMLKPVPEGFPFDTLTCDCDAATLWMNILEAHREIAELCQAAINRATFPPGVHDGRDWDERERDDALAHQARLMLAILAKTHGIEVSE